MRILIIPSADLSYNSGSVIYAKKLFVYLTKIGHDVYMLGNCMLSDILNDISTNIIIKNNLLFHPVIDDRYVSNEMYFYMFRDILDTVSYINSKIGKLDIIHAHYDSINSYAALVIYDLLNIPFIVSSFGRDVSIGYDCDNRIRNFIIKSYSSAKRIVVPDEGIKHLVKEKIDMDIEEKIIEVPMPLDDGIFEYSIENVKSLKKKGKIIISSINSCFTKEKGIEIILKALKLILKKHDVFLYIAGGDDDEKINFRRLKSLVDKLEISKYVVFLEWL